jgi:hypothetical protein
MTLKAVAGLQEDEARSHDLIIIKCRNLRARIPDLTLPELTLLAKT